MFLKTLLWTLLSTCLVSPSYSQSGDHEEQWAVLDRYCSDCHNLEDYSGGVAFDIMTREGIPGEARVWESAVRKLRGRIDVATYLIANGADISVVDDQGRSLRMPPMAMQGAELTGHLMKPKHY